MWGRMLGSREGCVQFAFLVLLTVLYFLGTTAVEDGLVIVSRDPRVQVFTDVRGNLGSPRVLTQDPPGKDWIRDRWQAASDMGGTAIVGVHWVKLDFHRFVSMHKLELDWEAAFSDTYTIMCRSTESEEWKLLYDRSSSSEQDASIFTSTAYGQSPGVKYSLPLHIVHTLNLNRTKDIFFRYLQLVIEKPAAGWGVSLWQVDVHGKEYSYF